MCPGIIQKQTDRNGNPRSPQHEIKKPMFHVEHLWRRRLSRPKISLFHISDIILILSSMNRDTKCECSTWNSYFPFQTEANVLSALLCVFGFCTSYDKIAPWTSTKWLSAYGRLFLPSAYVFCLRQTLSLNNGKSQAILFPSGFFISGSSAWGQAEIWAI